MERFGAAVSRSLEASIVTFSCMMIEGVSAVARLEASRVAIDLKVPIVTFFD